MSIRRRHRSPLVAVITASVLMVAPAWAAPVTDSAAVHAVARPPAAATSQVIVQAVDTRAAVDAVAAAHGRVTRALPIVDGVAATLVSSDLPRLASQPGVLAVTPDTRLHVQGTGSGQVAAAASGPVSVYGTEVGAVRTRKAGYQGKGVTVALLDTGVSANQDLGSRLLHVNVNGQSKPCENLSGERTCDDGYGHGTFMAGIIAGNGKASSGRYIGIAPQAKLVSIKVASADGSADVSNVLAGIQWAVSFRTQYNIQVLNLSLGTDSTQSWTRDPLNYAVERAWAAGITVIASASNRGPAAATISKPGDDPWVITVGAVDDLQTPTVSDDVSPDFSGRGPTPDGLAKPDVSAPGAHLVSLRVPGSTIDQQYPPADGGAYHQGSGTSMAAAVVSGVAALELSAHPGMAPNRLKYALMSTTRAAASTDLTAVGTGVVDAYAALNAPAGTANQGLGRSTGLGVCTTVLPPCTLDPSRGHVLVQTTDAQRTVVSGIQTVQLLAWDPVGFFGNWNATTWALSLWLRAPFYSTTWLTGRTWNAMDLDGCEPNTADDDCTYGHNWEGSTWYGSWD